MALSCAAYCTGDNFYPGLDGRSGPVFVGSAEPSPFHVLFYEDFSIAASIYQATLDDLGWPYLRVNEPDDLTQALESDHFSHVIVVHQATLGVKGFESPLLQWIERNPEAVVLISDWRVEDPSGYLQQLGFRYGDEAPDRLLPVESRLFDGLPPARLKNPGWFFVWSYATLGGIMLASDAGGHPIVARNGNVFFNGFLSDTFEDVELGMAYITRQLEFSRHNSTSAYPVPSMNHWMVMLLGLVFLGAGLQRCSRLLPPVRPAGL